MLRARLADALKDAMKAKDSRRVSTLRLILATLKDRDIAVRTADRREGIGEEDILQMLQTMIRQRRESVALYEQGGRIDLAQQEQEEIGIIESFLPRQLGEAEIADAARGLITELGAGSIKDMGRVMAALRQRYSGQMDFGKAAGIIKQLLV